MATSATHNSAHALSWEDLVDKVHGEITTVIQQENPDLLTNTFLETIRFLSHTLSSRELMERWLQSEENRRRIAQICEIEPQDVTKDCVETSAPFICLRVEKPGRISKPVPDKTLVIIAIGRLHSGNGMFTKVNLGSGGDLVLSGDETQVFLGGKRGGGIGVILRIKFKAKL